MKIMTIPMKTKKKHFEEDDCPPYSGAGVVVVSRHVEGDDGAMEGLPRLTPAKKSNKFHFNNNLKNSSV
jgi:hypothetical protein